MEIYNLMLFTMVMLYTIFMKPEMHILYNRRPKRSRIWMMLQQDARMHDDIIMPTLIHMLLGSPHTSWWVKPRSTVWWDRFVLDVYDDQRWKENFRMTRETFDWLCDKLAPMIKKKSTNFRKPLPVPIRVGAALYKLVKGCDLLEVSEQFAIGMSTASVVLKEVCYAINNKLGRRKIRWPKNHELVQVEEGFRDASGLPNCYDAVDCTHVQIIRPSGLGGSDYFDRKQVHSIIVQAVCDTSRRFTDIFVGFPGSTHDARVLRNSGLALRANARKILREPTMLLNGNYMLHPYVVGDKAYAVSSWIMAPYMGNVADLTHIQNLFNERHVKARLFIEQAFGILKRIFSCLKTTLSEDVAFVPEMIYSCCVLHNVLLERKLIDVEAELRALEDESDNEEEPEGGAAALVLEDGETMRRHTAEYLVFNT